MKVLTGLFIANLIQLNYLKGNLIVSERDI